MADVAERPWWEMIPTVGWLADIGRGVFGPRAVGETVRAGQAARGQAVRTAAAAVTAPLTTVWRVVVVALVVLLIGVALVLVLRVRELVR